MAVTDSIADMLTRIRNALHALHKDVSLPHSKMREALAGILKEEGYIEDYSVAGDQLVVSLKYAKGKSVISGMKKISKPSRRIYVGVDSIPRVQNGLGVCVLSTSSGVMSGETAHERRVGGEVLFEIW